MKTITYAQNAKGELVHVNNVASGLDCGCICTCCGEPLVAKKGQQRIWHFAHASGVECEGAYESMLHLLAKKRIKEAFLSNDIFNFEYTYRSYCPRAKTCGYVRYDDCYKSSLKQVNLKDYYDSCEEEVQYDKVLRRSDLKLFSSIKPERAPIYIEFFVTHASDDVKLHSGERIIEIKIDSEEDINRIVSEGFVQASEEQDYDNKIALYGFRDSDMKAEVSKEIYVSRFILYRSGKTQCYQDAFECNHLSKARNNSLWEMCFHTDVAFGIYEMAIYQAWQRFHIKNCVLCKNYVDSYDGIGKICRLYKYLGISRWEQFDTARAKECPKFAIDEEEMKNELKAFADLSPKDYTIFE